MHEVVLEADSSVEVATASITSEEMPQYGTITVNKTSANESVTKDNDDYSLEGAVYTVYADADCETEVTSITTDSTGVGTSSNLPLGTHYVKETTASEGYDLDTTGGDGTGVYVVTLSYDSSEETASSAINSEEPPIIETTSTTTTTDTPTSESTEQSEDVTTEASTETTTDETNTETLTEETTEEETDSSANTSTTRWKTSTTSYRKRLERMRKQNRNSSLK
ncbi:MAG: prealbumin-like fold domain-containing protein [Lachnospiraceae bacterium]|nr:prealbumin-like fold domain-containing protein [Lachnospiraceae bacterium]